MFRIERQVQGPGAATPTPSTQTSPYSSTHTLPPTNTQPLNTHVLCNTHTPIRKLMASKSNSMSSRRSPVNTSQVIQALMLGQTQN